MKHKHVQRKATKKTKHGAKPSSARYSTLTASEKAEYGRGIDLLFDLRHGNGPYSKLLRKHRLTRRKAERILGRNLLGGGRGKRIRASKTDRLVRELFVPTPVGDVRKPVRGLPAATKLSNYYNDRDKLLDNEMSAEDFEAKWSGEKADGHELLADTDDIFRMENAGVLKLENLYASVESPK